MGIIMTAAQDSVVLSPFAMVIPIVIALVFGAIILLMKEMKRKKQDKRVCPKCGQPVAKEKNFCTNCGEKVK